MRVPYESHSVQAAYALWAYFGLIFHCENLEVMMAQVSEVASEKLNPNMVPRGPGGAAGHAFRMIVMLCTGGFMYPNTFVEGMDCTALQKTFEQEKK